MKPNSYIAEILYSFSDMYFSKAHSIKNMAILLQLQGKRVSRHLHVGLTARKGSD